MRWVRAWLAACLATAAFGQVHIIDRYDVKEVPEVSTLSNPVFPMNGSNTGLIPVTNENSLLNEVNDVNNVRTGSAEGDTEESSPESTGEESPSNEISQPSNEIPSPSHEIPSQSNEIPSSSHESDSKENISVESREQETSESMPMSASGESSSLDSNPEEGPRESTETEASNQPPEIETTLGPVKGIKWHETNIIAYIDIPYGKTESPFMAPQKATPWDTVREVVEHSKRCPQYIDDEYVGELDCLTLSVFAPAGAQAAGVLFHIHDSSFHSGDPMIYGPEHLVTNGVILVLPNYRFGALGFLCLQNETAQGNAGLKDLSQALDWVVDNIEGFGGNLSNIVVGGDGDAGALAGYLALAPRSKSNIKKVITESGSMLSHVALDRDPEKTASTLSENIRNVDPDILLDNPFAETSVDVIVKAAKGMRFNPCIEQNAESFISATPWALLQNGEIDITFMIGSASHAGAHQAVATTDTFIENLNEDYGLILPSDLLFGSTSERSEHALKVKKQYFGEAAITREQVKELSLWFTDASYLGPVVRSARRMVEAGAAVYLFEFDYVGDLNHELISLRSPVNGAARSDIVGYLFTQDGFIPSEDSRDKQTIDLMVELWISFINTGIPSASSIEQWSGLKAGDASEEEFLRIATEPRLVKGVHVDRLPLWTQLYNEHFIERNFALSITPGNYLIITLIFWLTITKLDYQ